jgi:hypothetical protein
VFIIDAMTEKEMLVKKYWKIILGERFMTKSLQEIQQENRRMKKLFYSCPIKALYMARNFNVRFEDCYMPKIDLYDVYEDWFGTGHENYYVAEESYPIFDDIVGDVCIIDQHVSSDRLRNGKAFFNPESEE